MKPKFLLLILLLLLTSLRSPAQSLVSSNMVTYGAVNSTTNVGVPVLLGKAYVPTSPTFIISDGGCPTGTNKLTVNIKIGMGTNYFTTQATYTKSVTNAQEGTVTPATISFDVYAQTEVITTTNINVGTKAVFIPVQ